MSNETSNNAYQPPRYIPSDKPQFKLSSLLATMTGCCVLFAVLAAIGEASIELLIGCIVIIAVSIVLVVIISACGRVDRVQKCVKFDCSPRLQPHHSLTRRDNPFAAHRRPLPASVLHADSGVTVFRVNA